MWRDHDLKDAYDVVIIGGGVHGLATAYYLAQQGVTNVAVLEARYVGFGGSGRNTAIVRSNYRTPEGIAFYDHSVKLYEKLAGELDYNIMFSQRGHLTLAHTERGVSGLRERALTNQLCGVNSRLIFPDEIRQHVPDMQLEGSLRYPVMAALYHPSGGIIRHDAVVWAYARGADAGGVHVHQLTEVTDLEVTDGAISGVMTNRGRVKAGAVVNATAGYASTIAAMAGRQIPLETHPLQALVTEPLKPWLHSVIVSSTLHVYVSQTDRGELVIGAEVDDYASYSLRGTLPFAESAATHLLELFPFLANVRMLRQWAGLCDMTPDYSPIIGEDPLVKGLFMTVGWGTYGFKAGPASGHLLAEMIASGRTPERLEPFSPGRFAEDRLVGEKAAASVSH
ncbi:MAG TPA: sarcosine oxidase subunit beta [Planctomycetaceae bacterium]|nr:sarcosine oxidase subunit beta [Planctomycetaceae bacterium]HCD01577.1 sarcosine oxidase subunit beta [Planctomycetaceae bacterium]